MRKAVLILSLFNLAPAAWADSKHTGKLEVEEGELKKSSFTLSGATLTAPGGIFNIGQGTMSVVALTVGSDTFHNKLYIEGPSPSILFGDTNQSAISRYWQIGVDQTGQSYFGIQSLDQNLSLQNTDVIIRRNLSQSASHVGLNTGAPGSSLSVAGASTDGGASIGNAYASNAFSDGTLVVSGKIGIATSSPSEVLHVNGKAKIVTGLIVSSITWSGGTAGKVTCTNAAGNQSGCTSVADVSGNCTCP